MYNCGDARQRSRRREEAESQCSRADAGLERGIHLLDVPPTRPAQKPRRMAVVDPVFEELLEKEGEEKRGLWRVQNLELVPVPQG